MRVGTLAELTRGADTVEIDAKGLTAEMVAGLSRWGRVTAPGAGVDGRQKLALQVMDDAALPQIAAFLVGSGAQLYSLAAQRPSLEELFMRVMSEERA
jgi:hypothetical protein